MPHRTPADPELIRATYERTGSGRETARELGLHENTVYAALRRMRGKCLRCKKDVAVGRKYCLDCLVIVDDVVRATRAEQKRKGLCTLCNDPVAPPSRTMCAKHREERNAYLRDRYARTERRVGTHQGQPNPRQRERSIRERYGAGGLEAWHRDEATCVICGVGYGNATIQMHHKDLTKTNNSAENLVCLCFECHQLVHRLVRSRAPEEAVRWFRANYSGAL